MNTYDKNLLEQLRLVVLTPKKDRPDEASLVLAMTANENIRQLGYCLSPEGIVSLAKSWELESFYENFRTLVPDVKAEPMYPDFPSQVMEIDEAHFRFHQICHYMSTYGVEEIARMLGLDEKVRRGWLPDVERTEKTEKDTALLQAKTLGVISSAERFSRPLKILLEKSEKMTLQETEIVKEALLHTDIETLDLDIPFKQNMMYVFYALFCLPDRSLARKAMRRLCQHTGDVLKCLDYTLTRRDFHLKSAEKKQIVRLIEEYPVRDWKANVILTDKKARRTILVLQYLSYSRFSKSEEHMEVVWMLRDGRLSSWESQAKVLLGRHSEDAVEFISQRPGMMLRWTNWLIKLGYEDSCIEEKLMENVEELSLKTLVISAGALGKMEEKEAAFRIFARLLERRLQTLKTPLKGKKVYVDEGRLDAAHSVIKSKNDEAGYVRNGLAYRIPPEVKIVRFFVYWNDEVRVDIDLHASASNSSGESVAVGWNADFRNSGIVHSGDITHSDAAEYIDVDLSSDLREVELNVNLYAGRPNFSLVQECFIGLLAVDRAGKKINLYNAQNCFFYNDIRTRTRTINYGYINIPGRYLCLDGQRTMAQFMDGVYTIPDHTVPRFTLESYIRLLLKAQQAVEVFSREEADVELVMEKPESERQISLIDADFFM